MSERDGVSGREKAQSLLSLFSCSIDRDIEHYLFDLAIDFELLGKSRTFFVFDEEAATEDDLHILGYFSLAIQVMKIPEKLSNRKIKELDGYSAKAHGQKLTELPVILIGQLAKNDSFRKDFSGSELMEFCLNKVFDGQEILGGRIILLECKDNTFLFDFYGQFGFKRIEKEYPPDESNRVMIRIMHETELVEPSRIPLTEA